jgi:hypothetical protein
VSEHTGDITQWYTANGPSGTERSGMIIPARNFGWKCGPADSASVLLLSCPNSPIRGTPNHFPLNLLLPLLCFTSSPPPAAHCRPTILLLIVGCLSLCQSYSDTRPPPEELGPLIHHPCRCPVFPNLVSIATLIYVSIRAGWILRLPSQFWRPLPFRPKVGSPTASS